MKKTESQRELARVEIRESLKYSTLCTKRIGLTFFKEPKNKIEYYFNNVKLLATILAIGIHLCTDITNIIVNISKGKSFMEVVSTFHLYGYGFLSLGKILTLWYTKSLYETVIEELSEIWPMPPLSPESEADKAKTTAALKTVHIWYFLINTGGFVFYVFTPIVEYLFKNYWLNQDARMGFVWTTWYPFDQYNTANHILVYLFESFIGISCVWPMVGSDLLFSAMASHIGLLLRMLHRRLESFASNLKTDDENYEEIVDNIKVHQRLINYCNDLEQSFSMVNLINIGISSVNICCVVFVIVLIEPMVAISNKLFLCSSLIQVGMLCWYADVIYSANAEVSQCAWNSNWYQTSRRCQRALFFLIRRSQKPICLTAKGFTNITLVTFNSILTRSYSYFTLLYTMYRDN